MSNKPHDKHVEPVADRQDHRRRRRHFLSTSESNHNRRYNMKLLNFVYAMASAIIVMAALEVDAGPVAAMAAYGTCQSG